MKHLRRLGSHLRQAVTRGKITASVLNPIRTLLQVTALNGETFQNIELLLPPGMSALPTAGSIVLLQVGNSRSHLVALAAADDKTLRITDLQQGEFGFRDATGQQVVFRTDKIEVTSPTKDVVVRTAVGHVDLNGVIIDKDGNITAPGTVTASGEGTFNSHTVGHHIHSDPQGGSVGLPTG
jgi:phage gp45-like